MLRVAPAGVEPLIEPKARFELPPLILHPLLERGRSGLVSETLLGDDRVDRYLEARYLELRALCLLGKDINRWIEQCLDLAARNAEVASLNESTLLDLLISSTPENIVKKMEQWEVHDFQAIYARAIGLHAVFPCPPETGQVSETLLQSFHLYADALYEVRLKSAPKVEFPEIDFAFEVYASGEYARLLEQSWRDSDSAQ